jgi:hypothetical protein
VARYSWSLCGLLSETLRTCPKTRPSDSPMMFSQLFESGHVSNTSWVSSSEGGTPLGVSPRLNYFDSMTCDLSSLQNIDYMRVTGKY